MDVISVEVLHDLVVRLTFANGVSGEMNLEQFLQGGILEELRLNKSLFNQVSVDENAGTIVWPNGADLAPDVLYDRVVNAGAAS